MMSLMAAGLLGVAATGAMAAAVNTLLKKIQHAPSCEWQSMLIVFIWIFNPFSQWGVESVLLGAFGVLSFS